MIDELIISGIFQNEAYARKIIPHVLPDYFSDPTLKLIYKLSSGYFLKFNRLPTKEAIKVGLDINQKDIKLGDKNSAHEKIDHLCTLGHQDQDWLIEQTEEFCKNRAIFNAIMDSISIIDGTDKTRAVDSLPKLLQDALSVTFNSAVGHSYIDDAESRYDLYTKEEARVPFDIKILNEITRGGLPNKSLTVLLSQSGGGKSLVMCHMAAGMIRDNKNVLYITMEMAEEKIAERIDSNLMDTAISSIEGLGKTKFMSKIDAIKSKTTGKLYIKEYPSGRAHCGHFRALLSELKTKQNFIPDVIFVDYLGICASSTLKLGNSVNTYVYLKSVAEELRALSMECDLPIVTAGQVNRNGYNNSDLDLTDISDSLSIVMTADLILGVVRTEELDASNQIMMVQMKNRHSDPSINKRFLVGVDRAKMKLYDMGSDSISGIMREPDLAKVMTQASKDSKPNEPTKSSFSISKKPGLNLGSLST